MDFSDGSPGTKITPKQLAIIAGGILVAVLVVIGVVRFLQGDDSGDFVLTQVKDRRAGIESLCENAQNQEACLATESQKAALQTGQIDFCEGLVEEAYDQCAWELADVKQDPALCSFMHNETNRALCTDMVNLSLALASRDGGFCDKLTDAEKKEGCHEVVKGPVTAENCQARGKDAQTCETLTVAKSANEKQDPRVCDQLEGNEVVNCAILVEVDDPDFDGLGTTQEKEVYGTDPYNPDTDGDGFKDGDEVAAGYNPNGSGKLP